MSQQLNKDIQCDDCRFKTNNKVPNNAILSLFEHQLVRHMELPSDYRLICDKCGKKFLVIKKSAFSLHHFTKHTKWTEGDGHYCHDCGHHATTTNAIQQHIVAMHLLNDETPFTCDKCSKKLKTRSNTADHLQHCQMGNLKVECPMCFCAFAVKYLRNHIRTKHAQQPVEFVCEECSKKFSGGEILASHWKHTHGGILNVCQNCLKQFVYKGSLRQHQRSKH